MTRRQVMTGVVHSQHQTVHHRCFLLVLAGAETEDTGLIADLLKEDTLESRLRLISTGAALKGKGDPFDMIAGQQNFGQEKLAALCWCGLKMHKALLK